jgi:hypothetical protein
MIGRDILDCVLSATPPAMDRPRGGHPGHLSLRYVPSVPAPPLRHRDKKDKKSRLSRMSRLSRSAIVPSLHDIADAELDRAPQPPSLCIFRDHCKALATAETRSPADPGLWGFLASRRRRYPTYHTDNIVILSVLQYYPQLHPLFSLDAAIKSGASCGRP